MSEKFARHSDLAKAMSRTVGVDLGRRIVEGTLEPGDFNTVVVTCGCCANVAECEEFLRSGGAAAGGACAGAATVVPDFCLNRPRFAVLKDG